MDKNYFDFLINDLPENSVKKACYVIREYNRNDSENCVVSKEEYDYALSILLAYSYQTSDNETIAEQWYCDNDCDRNHGIFDFCPGEFQINKNAKKLCKYYIDSSNK